MQQKMMGQNIIITEPSSNLRALGRNALAGKWKLALIAVAVYYLCIQVPPVILDALFGVNMGDLYYNNAMSYDYSTMYSSMPSYSGLSGIYLLLVTGAFTLGITLFFLALFRRQHVGVSDVFLGFERFGKALGLAVFQGVFILLWSLLFIVPGIIASLRYSQAFFILADDPNKSIRQCMDESKKMMKGNKAKLFCLEMSFMGWILLATVPVSVFGAISVLLGASIFADAIIATISSLFLVPVIAYNYSTLAGFYEILAGHLIKETAPAPIAPDAINAVPHTEPEKTVPVTAEEPQQRASQPEEKTQAQAASNETKAVDVSAVFSEVNANSEVKKATDTAAASNEDAFIPKQVD